MKINEYRFRVFIIILLQSVFFQASSQNLFIENKGQFHQDVLAKINVPSGSLFIENNQLRFAFFSATQLKQKHDLLQKNPNN